MRAHEIMENLSPPVEQMMLKLRKGAAASLNAARLAEVFAALDSGWQIEKAKFQKPSEGGWLVKEVPGAQMFRPTYNRNSGRIEMGANLPLEREDNFYTAERKAEDVAKLNAMKNQIAPKIEALSHTTQKKWNVRDVIVGDTGGRYGRDEFVVSFQFIADCSGFLITSPDGQTYEVYGDYKNGAINPHTFEMFFHWAVENTDIMDQILAKLGMEPVEKKHDPKKPYTPPPTASEETVKVFEMLKELTVDIRAQQKIHMIEWMTEEGEKYIELMKAGDKEASKRMWANYSIFLQHAIKDSKVNPDWKKAIEGVAEEQVEAMQNEFVFKNTRKLAPILTAKGNVGQQKVMSINTRQGMITATLGFTFDDGSSFRVDQSVKQSHARDSWGRVTWFYQYPTTFHDVVLPDGNKMYPSEENMNEIFAKA